MTLGDYCDGVHLFPFRTEKLSPSAQMVLPLQVGEYVVAYLRKTPFLYRLGVFYFYNFTAVLKYFFLLIPIICFGEEDSTRVKNFQSNYFLIDDCNKVQIQDSSFNFPRTLAHYNTRLNNNFLFKDDYLFNEWSPFSSKNNLRTRLFSNQSIRFYNTNKPKTEINLEVASKEYQKFRFTHIQNFSKRFFVTACLNRMRSEGFYDRANESLWNVSLSSNYKNKKENYLICSGLIYNSVKNAENGGVSSDSVFENIGRADKKLVGVNLFLAENRLKTKSAFVKQFLFFGNKGQNDSIVKKYRFQLSLHSNVEQMYRVYSDESSSSEFYLLVMDTLKTLDSTYKFSFSNEVEFKTNETEKTIGFAFSIKYEWTEWKNKPLTTKQFNNVWLKSKIFNYKKILGTDFEIAPSYIVSGYSQGDYIFSGAVSRTFLNNNVSISAFGLISEKTPEYFYLEYYSNHFVWRNTLKKVNQNYLQLKLSFLKDKISTAFNYNSFENYLFLNQSSLPMQAGNSSYYSQYVLGNNLQIGKFFLVGNFAYNIVPENSVIRLPEITLSESFYFMNKAFKGKMNLQVGATVHYFSAYYADAYMPDLAMNYLQDEKKIGNYPFIDFFVNTEIKTATVYLGFVHVNSGMMGNTYYTNPHYPAPDRMFKFGINWRFEN